MANEELDRVVSRRVDHPTAASQEDEHAYRAAQDPSPTADTDTDTGGSGGAAERAARSTEADGDEPTRSE